MVERFMGDDDTAGVAGGVTGHSLELFSAVQQAFGFGVVIVDLFQFRHLGDGLIERGEHGDEFGHPVAIGIGESEHAADVANGRPGRHTRCRSRAGHSL